MKNTRKTSLFTALGAAAGIALLLFVAGFGKTRLPAALPTENCGIAGIVLFPKEGRADWELPFVRALMRELLVATSKRGTDATGLVLFHRNAPCDLLKRPLKASKFVALPEFEQTLGRITADTTLLIGHNRAASVGTPANNDNNHPVRAGPIWLVHNGEIGNHNALFRKHRFKRTGEVDTEVIAHLIALHNPDRVDPDGIRKACSEMEGAFAVAFADERDPGRLYLARNRPPMTYVRIPQLELLVFDSQVDLIRKAWTKTLARFPGREAELAGALQEQAELEGNSGAVVDVAAKSVTRFGLPAPSPGRKPGHKNE